MSIQIRVLLGSVVMLNNNNQALYEGTTANFNLHRIMTTNDYLLVCSTANTIRRHLGVSGAQPFSVSVTHVHHLIAIVMHQSITTHQP